MTTWSEKIAPGENELFEKIATELREQQRARIQKSGMNRRALHAKQHVGAEMELVVNDVPEGLRAGPFAEKKTWRGYVRFSNGSPARQHDRRLDARGIALKIVGVPGKKLIKGLEDKVTQDFLFLPDPTLPVRDPAGFMVLQRALMAGPVWVLPKLISSLGVKEGIYSLSKLLKTPNVRSMATTRFHSGVPIRLGQHAVKLDLVPLASDRARGRGKDALRDDLVARLASGSIEYVMRAQLFVDDERTPIEDASIEWHEPFVDIARVVIPRQDLTSERAKRVHDFVESLSFDPWHATEELRPLGGIMRARAAAYRESALERKAAPEPDGTERFE